MKNPYRNVLTVILDRIKSPAKASIRFRYRNIPLRENFNFYGSRVLQ